MPLPPPQGHAQYAPPPPNHQQYQQPPQQSAQQQLYQQPHGQVAQGVNPPPQGNFQVSNCQGRKRALLIGINYIGQKGELRGCINDVRNLRNFLVSRYNFRECDMVVLTDDAQDRQHLPTRANIISAMHWLVNNCRVNDTYFFHYSGHGGQVEDKDGDEDDGYDETIFPLDHQQAGQIVDDEMHAIMVRPLPQGVRLTAIFDSCHSGTALDLPYVYASDGTLVKNGGLKAAGSAVTGAGMAYLQGNMGGVVKSLSSGFKALTSSKSAEQKTQATRSTMADCVMFAGCKDSQTSADTSVQGYGSTGAMSYAFIAALTQNPNQTYLQLLNSLRQILKGKYSQKPQMSTGMPRDMNSMFFL
ncbi:peptidase C14, caspase domain-containing protein [Piptocephalis cylindrospora]|uniref:Peptidase C14, caspase domain-containing protein n=1 Tax=Piptocephalis cylindrospora TaxID=1907219 RepID=A0A4V1IXS0_9FUNG|nr:peptidase C14, caspase domain-containing protein [Piptocephalis cylindrospora]|eukprot:RKP12029.1 peptidase C14, caspase domain-containing protein [Piptocephalis cylindrospora]